MLLEGKIALITGASSGIGKAIAHCFAAEGCNLAINGRNEWRLREVSEQIKRNGRRSLILKGNVAVFDEVQRLGKKAIETYGRIDILVNNAGMSQPRTIMEISEMEWDLTISVNLKSAFNWCKAILPTMLSNGYGKIINISSVIAKCGAGIVSKATYATSKAGLLGLTRGLAKEAAPTVRVNAICPGAVDTPMAESITRGGKAEEVKSSIPLGRFGVPGDVAKVALFLASDGSDYITGEIIDVNGGSFID